MSNLIKITGLAKLEIDFVLALQETELSSFNLSYDLKEVNSIKDLQSFFFLEEDSTTLNKNLLERIRIDSSNFLINTCLFINRAFKEKVFIELITLREPKFNEEEEFFSLVFKHVLEQNLMFLHEQNIQASKANINFSIRVLNNDYITTRKDFTLNLIEDEKATVEANSEKEKMSNKSQSDFASKKDKSNRKSTNKTNKSTSSFKVKKEKEKKVKTLYEKLNYDFRDSNFFLIDFTTMLEDFINELLEIDNSKQQKEEANRANENIKLIDNEGGEVQDKEVKEDELESSLLRKSDKEKEKVDKSNIQEKKEEAINYHLKEILDLILFIFFNFQSVKKVVIFPRIPEEILGVLGSESIFLIREILSYSDLFIMEKEIAMLLTDLVSFEQGKENKEKKNNEVNFIKILKPVYTKIPRLCLLIENFQTLFILEQQPDTSLLLAHTDFKFNLFPDIEMQATHTKENYSIYSQQSIKSISKTAREKNELNLKAYELALEHNYSYLESIFFGGFLSRIIRKKSLKTCFTAGNNSVKRVLEILKLGMELPSDLNYYVIRIPKIKNSNKNEKLFGNEKSKDPMVLNKESNFILDCINLNDCRMKSYNPLYDNSLSTFFSSIPVRKHLNKLGFINRKGEILQDPDRKRMSNLKSKKLISEYEQEELKLQGIKENNQKMKLQIKNLFSGTIKNFQEVPIKELEKVTTVRNFKPISKKKLPSIPNYINQLSHKNYIYIKNNEPDLYAKNVSKQLKYPFNSKSKTKASLNHLGHTNQFQNPQEGTGTGVVFNNTGDFQSKNSKSNIYQEKEENQSKFSLI